MPSRTALRLALELMAIIVAISLVLTVIENFLDIPWWGRLIFGPCCTLTALILFNRHRVRRVQRRHAPPPRIWVDPSANPLDPRGDGTLQPGDPFFDNVFLPLMRGERDVSFVTGIDGLYEVHPPADGEEKKR